MATLVQLLHSWNHFLFCFEESLLLVDASEMGQKQKRTCMWLWKSLRNGTMSHDGSMVHDGLPHGICLSVCFFICWPLHQGSQQSNWESRRLFFGSYIQ